MVNSEMIRINDLANITSHGFIMKLNSVEKRSDVWLSILEEFETEVKSRIQKDEVRNQVKLIQHNTTNRGALQVPLCEEFRNLTSCLDFCQEFSARIEKEKKCNLNSFCAKMNLEQAFLAYASYQEDKDKADTAVNNEEN